MSLKKRIRYKFDNFMSRGPKAMFFALFILTFLSLLTGAILIFILTSPQKGQGTWWQSFWWSLLHLTDSGTFAGPEYNQTNVTYKIVSVIVTFFGILIFSLLIAFLNTFFQQKLEALQKGRSKVIEKDFTLILGWNDKIIYIIKEIIIANENHKNRAIVILAEKNKQQMDEILFSEISNRKTTRLITKSGKNNSFKDLSLVSFNQARSIIVLASANAGISHEKRISSDTEIMKTLLTILYHPEAKTQNFNIVTEINDEKNIEIINSFSQDKVTLINSNEIIAKVMTQTSRQTGLPVVYEELLAFDGCEIYLNQYNQITGKTFSEIYNKFPCGYPIGIVKKDKRIFINPGKDYIVGQDETLVVVAEDDDTCNYSEEYVCAFNPVPGEPTGLLSSLEGEKVLILGYNRKVINIVKEFEEYTAMGSEVTIVYNFTEMQKTHLKEQFTDISKMTLRLITEHYNDRDVLYKLNPFTYDIIFIISRDMNNSTIEKSDADTIFTLLILREIQEKTAFNSNTRIVTEILDVHNKELIETASVNDFIISFKLISMILAKVSEQKYMSKVYDDLFKEQGSEIYLKPANKYFDNLPRKLNFYQIMDRVFKRGEIAFGYKIYALKNSIKKNHGVVLNPEKDAIIELHPDDKIIVVAEDER